MNILGVKWKPDGVKPLVLILSVLIRRLLLLYLKATNRAAGLFVTAIVLIILCVPWCRKRKEERDAKKAARQGRRDSDRDEGSFNDDKVIV